MGTPVFLLLLCRYFALTINRRNLNPAPTDMTVAAMKEIAANLPSNSTQSSANWLEEISMKRNGADLVRYMIRWALRTTCGRWHALGEYIHGFILLIQAL